MNRRSIGARFLNVHAWNWLGELIDKIDRICKVKRVWASSRETGFVRYSQAWPGLRVQCVPESLRKGTFPRTNSSQSRASERIYLLKISGKCMYLLIIELKAIIISTRFPINNKTKFDLKELQLTNEEWSRVPAQGLHPFRFSLGSTDRDKFFFLEIYLTLARFHSLRASSDLNLNPRRERFGHESSSNVAEKRRNIKLDPARDLISFLFISRLHLEW